MPDGERTIHAYGEVPQDKRVLATRGLRSALLVLDQDASFTAIRLLMDTLEASGAALLGSGDTETLIRAATALEDRSGGTLKAALDADATTLATLTETVEAVMTAMPSPVAAGTPEPPSEPEAKPHPQFPYPATETAMVLLCQCEGNPVRAAAVAHNLSRTTQQPALYSDVVLFIVATFPWTKETLLANEILVEK